MSDEHAIAQPPLAQKDMPVHCAKCVVFNDRNALVCTACGAHLRLKCRKCQASNLRTASRCSRCHQLLRTGNTDFSRFKLNFKSRRWRRGWLKRRFQRWNGPAALLLAVGIILWLLSGGIQVFGIR